MIMHPAAEPDDALRRAEDRIFAAIAARDIGTLQAELTDDFVHTAIGGDEQDRSSFIEAVRAMPYTILDLRGENIQVRIMGDVGVLSGMQRARVVLPNGNTVSGLTAFVDLFVRSGTGWRLRHAWSVEIPVDATPRDSNANG
jgi:hypothetical protein